MTFLDARCALLLGAALSTAAFVPPVQAAQYLVLHHFNGSDGSYANGNLQFDSAGNLYGTTPLGGNFNHGTIYELTRSGQFSTVHSFSGGTDGADPGAGLTRDRATGDLYGTTTGGGAFHVGGIFKLTPDGTVVVLHDFNPDTEGDQPDGALTLDGQGNLYGTTYQDGPNAIGTVFELAANGEFRILHAFGAVGSPEGGNPIGRLERHRDNFYGVTTSGGAGTGSSIFKVTSDGAFSMVYNPFTEGFEGAPARDKSGNFYGAYTSGANDEVYVLNRKGEFSPLHAFDATTDGRFPVGDMLLTKRGVLYGATARGGPNGDNGTIYKLTLEGKFTLLHGLAGPPNDGTEPSGGLVRGPGGKLYGTAIYGGRYGDGIIFSVSDK
jgi:uncharacterized repeat protein (TIGR03803 family)